MIPLEIPHPLYKRKEYPPVWSYAHNYQNFCSKNNYVFSKKDMWKVYTPWFLYYLSEKYNVTIEELYSHKLPMPEKRHLNDLKIERYKTEDV